MWGLDFLKSFFAGDPATRVSAEARIEREVLDAPEDLRASATKILQQLRTRGRFDYRDFANGAGDVSQERLEKLASFFREQGFDANVRLTHGEEDMVRLEIRPDHPAEGSLAKHVLDEWLAGEITSFAEQADRDGHVRYSALASDGARLTGGQAAALAEHLRLLGYVAEGGVRVDETISVYLNVSLPEE